MSVLVMGIGNTLLGDEGAGVHALRLMHSRYGHLEDTLYLDAGTLSFTLAPYLADAQSLIVFDAARWGESAGTVRICVDEEMDRYLSRAIGSVHEVGLVDLLNTGRLLDEGPMRRALIGIEPEYLGWRDTLSASVAAALPTAVQLAAEQLLSWHPQRASPFAEAVSRAPQS